MESDSGRGREEREGVERLASAKDPGVLREFLALLRENRKWWLVPALLVLLATGLLILLASSGAAPFVYTLF